MLAIPFWVGAVLSHEAGFVTFYAPIEINDWIAIGIFYPLIEELVFRGLFMGFLSRYSIFSRGRFVSTNNILTSLIFAACHSLVSKILVNGLLVFLPSLWLGVIRERLGSVWMCCVIHAIWNLGLLAVLTFCLQDSPGSRKSLG